MPDATEKEPIHQENGEDTRVRQEAAIQKTGTGQQSYSILGEAERGGEGVDVLGEVAELTEDTDEAGHGDAIEDGLWVELVGDAVQVTADEGVLVPDLVPRQGHYPRSSDEPKWAFTVLHFLAAAAASSPSTDFSASRCSLPSSSSSSTPSRRTCRGVNSTHQQERTKNR
jgi:hypothetical protein